MIFLFWRLYYTLLSWWPFSSKTSTPLPETTHIEPTTIDVEDTSPDGEGLGYEELWGSYEKHYLVNISLVWDLDRYNSELTLVTRCEDDADARLRETFRRHSDSHTTFERYELMPQQAVDIKAESRESEGPVLEFIKQLERELPELIDGRPYEAIEIWWFDDEGTRMTIRHLPSQENQKQETP